MNIHHSPIEALSPVPAFKPLPLAYCDYIADRIHTALCVPDRHHSLIGSVCGVKWDLHPTAGYMMSTKKTILVADRNGKEYRVTVEEVRP